MRVAFPFLLALCLSACISVLKADVAKGPAPVSDSSFGAGIKPFSKIMVIPPSGTVRGGFEREGNLFEKFFLRSGVTVISPAITGRVLEAARTEDKGTAVGLSDVERALLMAKGTGAEALLQVGAVEVGPKQARFLCGQLPEKLDECDRKAYLAAPYKALLTGPSLRFIGRLIEVNSGEVVASLDISQAIVNALVTSIDGIGQEAAGQDLPSFTLDCTSAINSEQGATDQSAAAGKAQNDAAAATAEAQPVDPNATPEKYVSACREANIAAREELINQVVAQVASHKH